MKKYPISIVITLVVITVLLIAAATTIANAAIGDANACAIASKKGFKDGQNHNFDQSIFTEHSKAFQKCYQTGFRQGCLSVKGNTEDACTNAEDA